MNNHKLAKIVLWSLVFILVILVIALVIPKEKPANVLTYETVECLTAICTKEGGKTECTEIKPKLYGISVVSDSSKNDSRRIIFDNTEKTCGTR